MTGIWRDGDSMRAGIGGTGAISCLAITEDVGLEAESRRVPIGFRVGAIIDVGGVPQVPPRPWGECVWTARDLLQPACG